MHVNQVTDGNRNLLRMSKILLLVLLKATRFLSKDMLCCASKSSAHVAKRSISKRLTLLEKRGRIIGLLAICEKMRCEAMMLHCGVLKHTERGQHVCPRQSLHGKLRQVFAKEFYQSATFAFNEAVGMRNAWRRLNMIDLIIRSDFLHERIDVFGSSIRHNCVRHSMCRNPMFKQNACDFCGGWTLDALSHDITGECVGPSVADIITSQES